jgi:hypothetical protein
MRVIARKERPTPAQLRLTDHDGCGHRVRHQHPTGQLPDLRHCRRARARIGSDQDTV